MRDRLLINIYGKYLGRIVSSQENPDRTVDIITKKVVIHRAEPVKNLDEKTLINLWKELKEESDALRAGLFLTIANVQYDRRKITPDDILPVLSPDADAIIVLRDNNWNKVPLEAIGLDPMDANAVAKWYTLYTAIKHTLLNYHHDLDRYRAELIRYAEFNKKLMKVLSERDRIVTELQSKMSDLNLQLYSLTKTIDNMEKLVELSGKEAETWRQAYTDLKNKLRGLLDIVPTLLEYVNKLATVELEKEVETTLLKQQMSVIDNKVSEAISDIYELKKELKEIKETAKREEERRVEETEEKVEEETTEEKREEETGEKEEEEFL